MPALVEIREQAITGVSPPQLGEAVIRDIWPSVAANSAAAAFARACYKSTIFAPIGWLALAPLYFKKLLAVPFPFGPGISSMAERYRLTNRRLMICKGMRPVPTQEIPLNQIHDVVIEKDANSEFFYSGTLIIRDANGRTLMTLPGVREPESAQQHILQAVSAWGPMLVAGK
jgi:hypothetical protein